MFTGKGSPHGCVRQGSRPILTVLAAVTMLATFALPQEASAQRVRAKFKDKVHVVQPKPVLQKGRFELATRFGGSVNDDIYQSFKLGVSGNYHIAESFYVGAMFDWFNFGETLGGPTNAFEQVRNEAGAAVDSAVINYTAGLELGFVPFWGKFSFFNSAVIFYDFTVTAGGVWIDAESVAIQSPSGKPGGTISLTGHLFLNKWIALNLEVRDVIFMQDLEGVSGALTNVVTVGGGFSFYLPTTFEYSERVVEVQQ